jgi:uncharacterized protein (DUF3820 family)
MGAVAAAFPPSFDGADRHSDIDMKNTSAVDVFMLSSPSCLQTPESRRSGSAPSSKRKNYKTIHMQPEDLKKLVTITMPFGKYQGRLIADLPGAYLAWFAHKGFPRGELGNLLALMLEIDHNGLRRLLDPLRKA